MRVIVVGAGIGGLRATIALRSHGHEVAVLERASELEPVGAGITLFANAMRALERLGVADAVAARGSSAKRSAVLTSTGRQLTALSPDLLDGAIAVRRGDLQAVLLQAAQGVNLGVEVSSVEQTADRVTATLADGTEESGELLVGADGLGSVVRGWIAESAPRYGGYTAGRAISPVSIEPGNLSKSWGTGERFGLVDIGSSTYWFATANTPEGEHEEPDRRKAEVIRRFSHWHEPIASVVQATPDSAILRNDVYFLEPLQHWSKGRIVLLGDAAHATTPGVGQGAAQALEDGVVLAEEIARGDDLGAALVRFESIRRSRAALVLRLSRQTDRLAQLASPLGCLMRNALVHHIPESVRRRQLAPLIQYQLPCD